MRHAMRWMADIVLAALVSSLSSCSRGDAPAQIALARRDAQALIASQVASEFGVWHRVSEGRIAFTDIQLEAGPTLASGIQVVRGIPPRDHWHPYLVAIRAGELCPVGGFTAPQLHCTAPWITHSTPAQGLAEISRILAILADDNGAVRLFPAAAPGGQVEKVVSEAWSARRPRNWPQDTSFLLPEDDVVVRVTMLSQQTRSYDQAWLAIAYDFRFDAQRHLLAWSRRKSQPFVVSGSR